jgi:pantoate--beta-alanine ligase
MSLLVKGIKRRGKSIGFVPTMGCLHEGHLSLIRRARKENDVVIVSIFVNPIQFGPREDYKRYPRNLTGDIKLVKSSGGNIIFNPTVKSMYPKSFSTSVRVRGLTELLCGISRPGHFEGVTTVCTKLFNIVRPDVAYFGQKDYQQAAIIKRMAEDLNMGFKIKVLPIVREPSGLAMSSRNKYLFNKKRKEASIIYRTLKEAKRLIKSGEKNTARVKECIKDSLLKNPYIKIDYIAVVDPQTLMEQKRIASTVVIAIAVWMGGVRLIDNILVSV